MEENTVELIDYLRVIWKRKILIIVMILVGSGIGGGVKVMSFKPEPEPVTSYSADAVIKIGKKVRIMTSSGSYSPSTLEYIEAPQYLVESIPIVYGFKLPDSPEYLFEVEQVGSTYMLRLTMKGPDKGVEKILEDIVGMLISDHRIKAKDAVEAYENFMTLLEKDAEKLKEEIAILNESLKEMKKKEGEHLILIDSETKAAMTDEKIGDRSAFLNMLYLKTVDKENKLSTSRSNLREVRMKLVMHQLTLGNLEEYKTEMVGEIKYGIMVMKSQLDNNKELASTIVIGGMAGLIMSLCIAFFIEYIESHQKRKGKLQG